MIVYGVAANVSIAQLFIAGVIPGILLAALFSGYIVVWSLVNPGAVPRIAERTTFVQKLYASRHLIPVVALIGAVLGSIYAGVATATEAAAFGVVGSLRHLRRAGVAHPRDLRGKPDGGDAPLLHDRADPRRARPSSRCRWATSGCRATSPSGSAGSASRRSR